MDLSSGFVRGNMHVDGSVLCSKIREERRSRQSFQSKKTPTNKTHLDFHLKCNIYMKYCPDSMNNHVCHFSDGHSSFTGGSLN